MEAKYPVQCRHCGKPIGFKIGRQWMDDVYCYACEPAVTHKEEMRDAEIQRYRELAR